MQFSRTTGALRARRFVREAPSFTKNRVPPTSGLSTMEITTVMSFSRSAQRLSQGVTAAALVLLGVGFVPARAEAQVVYACVNANNGNTRIVSAAEACRNPEYKTQWNAAGPQGPQGPQGPAGPQGA